MIVCSELKSDYFDTKSNMHQRQLVGHG